MTGEIKDENGCADWYLTKKEDVVEYVESKMNTNEEVVSQSIVEISSFSLLSENKSLAIGDGDSDSERVVQSKGVFYNDRLFVNVHESIKKELVLNPYDQLDVQHKLTLFRVEMDEQGSAKYHRRRDKGILLDGREISGKKLFTNVQHKAADFYNEVRIISSIRHKNLVKLFGCSGSGPESILVYKVLTNGNLDRFIFDSRKGKELKGTKRFNIIIEAAEELVYLHGGVETRIVHRDIKSSNLLWDSKLWVKIADFGLAMSFKGDKNLISNDSVGTLGYMAPEYIGHIQLTEKVVVYSDGVFFLEIVTGRQNNRNKTSRYSDSLVTMMWKHSPQGRVQELFGTKVKLWDDNNNMNSEDEMLRVVHVGLLCTQKLSTLRPSMSTALQRLSRKDEQIPSPTLPSYIDDDELNIRQGGKAAVVVNRMLQKKELPKWSEGSTRVTFCHYEKNVQAAMDTYAALDSSVNLPTGCFGQKKSGAKVQVGIMKFLKKINPSLHEGSEENAFQDHSRQNESAPKPEAICSNQSDHVLKIVKDCQDQEMGVSSGAIFSDSIYTLAYPSFYTADVHFNLEKAFDIIIEQIDKFIAFPLKWNSQPNTAGGEDEKDELKYDLYVFVVYIGHSFCFEHYYCFIHPADSACFKFDDSKLTWDREECVLSLETYIPFYAKRGTPRVLNFIQTRMQ